MNYLKFCYLYIHILFPLTLFMARKIILNRYFKSDSYFDQLMWLCPCFLTFMAIICYNKSVFTRAGPVKIKEILEEEPYNQLCDKCGTFKPPRVHHCNVCRRCVFRMDHHCTWIYNCIGAKNQKFFLLFLSYTFLYCIYLLLLTIVAFGIWCYRIPEGEFWEYLFKPRFSKTGTTILFFLSIGFGFFSLEYLASQLDQEERKVYGRKADFETNFTQIFGTNTLFWLLPIAPKLDMNYLELVYEEERIYKQSSFVEDYFNEKSGQYYSKYQKYKYV